MQGTAGAALWCALTLLLTQGQATVPCGNSSLTLPSWRAGSEYLTQCVLSSASAASCDWTRAQAASGDESMTYLESKAFRLHGEACLEFWYQTGPTTSESSELRVLMKENTQGVVQIWTSPAQPLRGVWNHVSVPLAHTVASIQVVFEAAQGSNLEGHASFNHIGIRTGQCGTQCDAGSVEWTDRTTRCECSPAQQLSCSSPLCPGGPGRPGGGSPRESPARGACTVHTDPQCSTFDGALFRFLAPCTYILARTCQPKAGLPDFSVEVVNAAGPSNVSGPAVQRVNLHVNGVRLSLLKGESQRVMVNGVWRTLPLTLHGDMVHIHSNPAIVTVETNDRVLVSYDNAGAVHVKLPAQYAGKVCGMCGNFNSLREDDNLRPDGSEAPNAADLARSWQTGALGARCETILVPHTCDPLEEDIYGGRGLCGALLSGQGPFSRCLSILAAESYFRSCVAGMCASHGDLATMCHTLQSYANICHDAGVAMPAWRNSTYCTLECGANSHYEACAHGCQDTCSSMDLAGACGSCEERCVCDQGYKLSGGVCVLAEECGCWNNGRHYEKGAVFIVEGCTHRCQCLGKGQTMCSVWHCLDSQVCKDKNGVKGCFDPETVTCSVYGDPHYITYDNKAYDFQGGCNYTLATTCGQQTPARFTVTGRNVNPTDQNLTRSKLDTVVLQIQELHLTLNQNGKVYVHNDVVRLPYSSTGSYGTLTVHRERQHVVVDTDVGLRVIIDEQNRLFLQVDERYKGQMCGMCGTYSNWQGDDFVRPDGSNATGSLDFGNSWRVKEDSSPCIAYPDDPKTCDKEGDEMAVRDCSALLGDSFSPCHELLHPLTYISSCVYDHCATNGDLHTLCDSLGSYAAACLVAGVELPDWKNNTACTDIQNTTPPPTTAPLPTAPTPDHNICTLNCNFDSHMCGWQQLIQDSFDWTRQSGPTHSSFTGPNEDHTTGKGYYMYIEADGMTHGDSARLLSTQCQYSGPLCLQFWYHMYGSANAMALNIYHLNSVKAEKIWSMANNKGPEWQQALINIEDPSSFQIIIEAIRGSDARSDVAIDDISILYGYCSNASPKMVDISGSSSVPHASFLSHPSCSLDCSFNGNLCGWSQALTDAFDWTMNRGSTPTLMTGPSADHTGGTDDHYLYIEANSATHGDTARLLSSECSHSGPQCLRFWYHMYGSADTMGLHVYLLQDRLANAVWWKRNDQGNMWHEAMVDIMPTGPFQIIIEGRRGSNERSDVAIDDLELYPGLCSDQSGLPPSSPQPHITTTTLEDLVPSTAALLPTVGDVGTHTTLTISPAITSDAPVMTTNTAAPSQDTHPVCQMNCNFEHNLCEWNQMVTDVFDWSRHNGSTPTIMTGPSSDITDGGGHYLYIEANSATHGDTARLLSSECLHTGPQCLRFWYHMYGSADTMGLHVYLLQDRLAEAVWRKRNDQGNMWHEAMVDITPTGPFQIIFEGRRGSNDHSDVAIDDVSLHPGYCADGVMPTTSELSTTTTTTLEPHTTPNLEPVTTEEPLHPSDAPEISTTVHQDILPSEQPKPQTTEEPPTTSQPQPPTTKDSRPQTTLRPQPPTTALPPSPTSVILQPSTTEGQGLLPTSSSPMLPTSNQTEMITTLEPISWTTERVEPITSDETSQTTERLPTTEELPHPSTTRRTPHTTANLEPSTTEEQYSTVPLPQTTESVPYPTTTRPHPPTTEDLPHPSTTKPKPHTTANLEPQTTEGVPTASIPQPPTTEVVPTESRPPTNTTANLEPPTTEEPDLSTTRPQPLTTEDVPNPTTSRPQPQTTGVSYPTTTRPQPPTTEELPYPSTTRPKPHTTANLEPQTTKGVPTVSRPQPPTTEELPYPSTTRPHPHTTANLQPSTREEEYSTGPTASRPQPPTTEGVPYPTTTRPQPPTTEELPYPSTTRPKPHTTANLEPQTTEGVPTASRPQPPTTEVVPTESRPPTNTTANLERPTTEEPDLSTTRPQPLTTEEVPNPTTSRPQPQTTGVSYPTTTRPQPPTTEELPYPSTTRPHPHTTANLQPSTTEEEYSTGPTASRPQPPTTEGVPYPTTTRPQPPTTEELPYPSTTRPKPHTTANLEPQTTEGVPTASRPQPPTTEVVPTESRPPTNTTANLERPTTEEPDLSTTRPQPLTTEEVPNPTTSRPQPQTTGVSYPTTTRPQPPTTEELPYPSTTRPHPHTTANLQPSTTEEEYSTGPTASRPQPPTTEGVPYPSTTQPQLHTTASLEPPTTEAVPTTSRPQPPTTEVVPTEPRPPTNTTANLEPPTTEEQYSTVPTASRPQPPTTEVVSTASRPQPPTTEVVSTASRPQPPTTEVVPTASRPQPPTTEVVPTASRPQPPTTEELPHPSTTKPQPSATANIEPPTTEELTQPTATSIQPSATERPHPPTTTALPPAPTKPVLPTTARPQQSTTLTPTPSCPENSQYSACMPPCRPTCIHLHGPPGCSQDTPCVQGCVCDTGFVLRRSVCVPVQQCGCVDREGRVHNFNDEWYTAHCGQKCECEEDDGIGEIQCDDEECDSDDVCLQNTEGQYNCISTDFTECSIQGDPEYRTFDGLKHAFRGKHSYVLAQTADQSRTLPGFYIEGRNNDDHDDSDSSEEDERSSEEHHHRDRHDDSDEEDEEDEDDSRESSSRHRLRALKIRVYNHTVEFTRNRRLLVDGRISHPPVSPSGGLTIRQRSNRLSLKTDFGLAVEFDGRSAAEIILPHVYRRRVGGLCGNFDGKRKNDLMRRDGLQAASVQEFGQSWRVHEHPLRLTRR